MILNLSSWVIGTSYHTAWKPHNFHCRSFCEWNQAPQHCCLLTVILLKPHSPSEICRHLQPIQPCSYSRNSQHLLWRRERWSPNYQLPSAQTEPVSWWKQQAEHQRASFHSSEIWLKTYKWYTTPAANQNDWHPPFPKKPGSNLACWKSWPAKCNTFIRCYSSNTVHLKKVTHWYVQRARGRERWPINQAQSTSFCCLRQFL